MLLKLKKVNDFLKIKQEIEVDMLFDDERHVCNRCNTYFEPIKSKYFCSGFCEFMFFVENKLEEIETMMENHPFKCKICKSNFKMKINHKTFYPYCSRKCMNHGHERNTKRKLIKFLKWLGEIHNGKISNNQINKTLGERILIFFPTVEEGVLASGNEYVHIKKGFRSSGRLSKAYKRKDIKDLFVRSSWEANIIRILKFLKWDFDYEPKVFEFPVKKGNRFYLPDLYMPQFNEYWEIKGYMDASSKTKIKRFRKYYPENKLYILGKTEYKKIQYLGYILKKWEWSDVNEIIKNGIFKREILKNGKC